MAKHGKDGSYSGKDKSQESKVIDFQKYFSEKRPNREPVKEKPVVSPALQGLITSAVFPFGLDMLKVVGVSEKVENLNMIPYVSDFPHSGVVYLIGLVPQLENPIRKQLSEHSYPTLDIMIPSGFYEKVLHELFKEFGIDIKNIGLNYHEHSNPYLIIDQLLNRYKSSTTLSFDDFETVKYNLYQSFVNRYCDALWLINNFLSESPAHNYRLTGVSTVVTDIRLTSPWSDEYRPSTPISTIISDLYRGSFYEPSIEKYLVEYFDTFAASEVKENEFWELKTYLGNISNVLKRSNKVKDSIERFFFRLEDLYYLDKKKFEEINSLLEILNS